MDLSEEQSSSSPSKSLGVNRASARAAVEGDKSTVPVSEGTGLVGPTVVEQEKKTLNPNAKAWDPKADGASEEDRCLFLTLSNVYALSKGQIKDFFNRKYGKYVETVDLHNGADLDGKGMQPLFGKVIFKWSCIPAAVMAGATQVNLVVDKKHLWCKRFHFKKIDSVIAPKTTAI